jgi:hypothetical protein
MGTSNRHTETIELPGIIDKPSVFAASGDGESKRQPIT